MIHYPQKRSIQLRIVPVTAMKSKLSENVGVLTIIFISILLIILLMVLLTMMGLRRRRNPKDREVKNVHLLKPVSAAKDEEVQGGRCVRHAELYEPLNVSFRDLYHTYPANPKIYQTWHQSNDKTIHSNSTLSSKEEDKDDSSGLGSSSTSDSFCIGADIEIDNKCSTAYTETHFDHSSSPSHTPPPPHPHHSHCPWPPHNSHTLDPSHSTPYTLFHCQHRCFHPPPI